MRILFLVFISITILFSLSIFLTSCSEEPTNQPPSNNQNLYSPSNLIIISISASEIRLQWNDNSSSEDGFIIERALNETSFNELARVGSNITYFIDDSLDQIHKYCYRLKAFAGQNTSEYSEVLTLKYTMKEPALIHSIDAFLVDASLISFQPQGDLIAVGSRNDTKITIWDVESGLLEKEISISSSTYDLKFHPDGQILVHSGYDNFIRLIDINTLNVIRTIPDGYGKIDVSPDGSIIASSNNGLRLIDFNTGEDIKKLSYNSTINGINFSPDGSLIAAGFDFDTIKVWQVYTGELDKILIGQDGHAVAVKIHPNNQILGSGYYDNKILLWDIASGTIIKELIGHESSQLSFHPFGEYLVSSEEGAQHLWIWSLTDGVIEYDLNVEHRIAGLEFNRGGNRLATGNWNGDELLLWDCSYEWVSDE